MDSDDGLPPRIGIDRPGSFSRSVFQDRHPVLIANLLADLPYPPRIRQALEGLLAETLRGTVPAAAPPGPEREHWWNEIAERAGTPWDALPFLWAESYFYRRLLVAAEYFAAASPWHGVDPFAPQKHAQLDGPELRADLDAYAGLAKDADPVERRGALLAASLWGNQADLGFRTDRPGAATRGGHVVVDDAEALWRLLDAPGEEPVIVVADNAGRELTADLAFIDVLLGSGTAGTRSTVVGRSTVPAGSTVVAGNAVELHLKPHPYFVSDATGRDVLASLDALAADPHPPVRDLAERLRGAVRDGRLRLRTHPFYTLPADYRDLPEDLAADFAAAKAVVLKGDLNYRRLVGDREWDPTTPFAEAVAHFPGAVAALRTAKSDLAVGVAPDRLARLDAESPDWRVSGTHAFLQVRPRTR